jgi:OmpA-OmpF porin, OOP family
MKKIVFSMAPAIALSVASFPPKLARDPSTFREKGLTMKKVLLSAAVATAFSFASFAAAAATHDGAFVSVTAGGSQYDVHGGGAYDKKDSSVNGLVGYRWVVDRPFSIGVEAGYANLGKMTYNDSVYDDYYGITDTVKAKFKGKAVLVGANGKWDLPNGFTITAHAGLAHSQIDFSAREYIDGDDGYHRTYKLADGTSHDNAIYAGLGFGYDFSPNFGISVVYDHYALKAEDVLGDKRTVNVGVFGGTVEYRF